MAFNYDNYYSCVEEKAKLIRDDIYELAKKSPDYDGYYTNIPSTMISRFNNILISEMGLDYSFCDGLNYYFNIIDKKKFSIIKIKHGL